jgi:hypothetical protein
MKKNEKKKEADPGNGNGNDSNNKLVITSTKPAHKNKAVNRIWLTSEFARSVGMSTYLCNVNLVIQSEAELTKSFGKPFDATCLMEYVNLAENEKAVDAAAYLQSFVSTGADVKVFKRVISAKDAEIRGGKAKSKS